MAAGRYDFVIEQGATFNPVLRLTGSAFTKKTITGITNSGRAVVTAASHGIVTAGSVYVVGVVGMEQINHKSRELDVAAEAYNATVTDANSLTLDLDTSRFGTYVSGGELLYRAPIDLTAMTARMHIRLAIDDAAAIVTLTTENGGLTLGGTAGTITVYISATDTAALDFTNAVYDIEIISAGVVTRVLEGSVAFSQEVTR
jgi:hypothetical protein